MQKTQGVASCRAVAELLAGLGQAQAIVVTARPGPGLFSLDDYVFDGPGPGRQLLALVPEPELRPRPRRFSLLMLTSPEATT